MTEEGLFTGASPGVNVIAAIELGQRLAPDTNILVDSGLKYLSTNVFRKSEV
ncbi:hypothetical protein [Nocardia sp. CS682]|uniref:hypothetical protein n=1 Tax=Nocardia sp. CS682 TaxID=1047172 RepID=UPI0019805530|nr:hypothetical protein [Nocardia sp. CS682]